MLALTAAQVAQCVGVSRPALYKHLNNEPVRDMQAYQRVYQIACRINDEIGILDKRQKSILVDGKTLPRYLCNKQFGEEEVLVIARQIHHRMQDLTVGSAATEVRVTDQRLISRSVTRAG